MSYAELLLTRLISIYNKYDRPLEKSTIKLNGISSTPSTNEKAKLRVNDCFLAIFKVNCCLEFKQL